jgi:hypothetical protein
MLTPSALRRLVALLRLANRNNAQTAPPRRMRAMAIAQRKRKLIKTTMKPSYGEMSSETSHFGIPVCTMLSGFSCSWTTGTGTAAAACVPTADCRFSKRGTREEAVTSDRAARFDAPEVAAELDETTPLTSAVRSADPTALAAGSVSTAFEKMLRSASVPPTRRSSKASQVPARAVPKLVDRVDDRRLADEPERPGIVARPGSVHVRVLDREEAGGCDELEQREDEKQSLFSPTEGGPRSVGSQRRGGGNEGCGGIGESADEEPKGREEDADQDESAEDPADPAVSYGQPVREIDSETGRFRVVGNPK